MMKCKLIGDWSKAQAILNDVGSVKAAINYAVLQEAHQARRDVIKGITSQAPGGQQFTPLSALTLALRKARGFGGKKALIVTASLRNSVTVKQLGSGRAFLGVLRSARGKDGKSTFNIAKLHENGGTFVIRVTPKMRKYLMMQMRKTGIRPAKVAGGRDKGGRFKKSKFQSSGTGQLSRGVIVVRIPARPFIGPVIDKIASNPAGMQRRLAARISKKLRLTLG